MTTLELLPIWPGEFRRWVVLCERHRDLEGADCTAYYERYPEVIPDDWVEILRHHGR